MENIRVEKEWKNEGRMEKNEREEKINGERVKKWRKNNKVMNK